MVWQPNLSSLLLNHIYSHINGSCVITIDSLNEAFEKVESKLEHATDSEKREVLQLMHEFASPLKNCIRILNSFPDYSDTAQS